ncbi:protein of unknown function [Micromonospora yangpuensis]|uniref:DUF4291 domain-containing protein n=1 Tax=Micromonospora yangpuensis TaxID=683228 RepID=A0A1C6UK99_9ACTN|nr:protein of unknown function [Micromonospora yangpuensis]
MAAIDQPRHKQREFTHDAALVAYTQSPIRRPAFDAESQWIGPALVGEDRVVSVPVRQVRARYSADSITVYQAYPPQIAVPAVATGRFVAPFKRERMTWIKPSFLWLMYRCGWATKPGQEHVLAVEITRDGFEWALPCRPSGQLSDRLRDHVKRLGHHFRRPTQIHGMGVQALVASDHCDDSVRSEVGTAVNEHAVR